jgi:hypothetical protein
MQYIDINDIDIKLNPQTNNPLNIKKLKTNKALDGFYPVRIFVRKLKFSIK